LLENTKTEQQNQGYPALYFQKLTTLVRNRPLPSDPQWRDGTCATLAADEGIFTAFFLLRNSKPLNPNHAGNYNTTMKTNACTPMRHRLSGALAGGWHRWTRLLPSYNLVVFYFLGGCAKVVGDPDRITWS